jgi:IclR family mhp operon transcriptional activator
MSVYNPVRALDRGLRVLQIINQHDGIKTQEIARLSGLARPTVFRLLETLEASGFVRQSESSSVWFPTLECHSLSSGFMDKSWIGNIAMPEMIRLGEKVLWPLDLVTLEGDAMQIRESTHKLSPFSFDVGMVGRRVPLLHTAGGYAYLAFCPENEREVIIDMLRTSAHPDHALIHEGKAFEQILEDTRKAGYGYRVQGGYRSHTQSVSAPIFSNGRVLACLTIICLKSALSFDTMVRDFVPLLQAASQRISDKIETEE